MFLLALALPAAALAGGTITVNSLDDFVDFDPGDGNCTIDAQTATCSLRAAVEEANANGALDTISFQGGLSGAITLSLGEIGITSSLVIQGPGPDVVTIDADDASRHFLFTGVSLEISGLTLTAGLADGEYALDQDGGSLQVAPPADSVQLSDLVFAGNHAAAAGGAVVVLATAPLSELILEGVDLIGNTAGGYGGALAIVAATSLHVTDSTFVDNHAGTPDLVSGAGGAIYFNVDGGASAQLRRSTFSGNQALGAAGFGGALYLQNDVSGDFGLTVDRCSWVANSAANGGASYLYDVVGSVTNSTLGANQAPVASALYLAGGTQLTLASCTVAANGGGGAPLHVAGGSTLSVGHTLIAHDSAACLGAAPVSLGYNVIDGTSCSLAGTEDLSSTDPLLGPLVMDGGVSPGFVPYTISPAVDSGDPGGCPSPALAPLGTLAQDQWGQPRPWDGDADGLSRCDRGAVETQRLLYDGFETGNTQGWSNGTP